MKPGDKTPPLSSIASIPARLRTTQWCGGPHRRASSSRRCWRFYHAVAPISESSLRQTQHRGSPAIFALSGCRSASTRWPVRANLERRSRPSRTSRLRCVAPTGDALFVDDSISNIQAATEVGMLAHHFTGHEAMSAFLRREGVLAKNAL